MLLQLGHPPFRVDILSAIDGVEFEDCYPRRLQVKMSGVMIPFIGLEDLRKNKAASNCPKDQDDLLNL